MSWKLVHERDETKRIKYFFVRIGKSSYKIPAESQAKANKIAEEMHKG